MRPTPRQSQQRDVWDPVSFRYSAKTYLAKGSFLYQVQPVRGHRERCRAARSIAGHVDLLPVPGDGVKIHDWMRVEIEKRSRLVALKMVASDADAGGHQRGR